MTRASVDDQIRLLDLQRLDTSLARLGARRRALPETAETDRLTARTAALEEDAVIMRTRISDLDREVAKVEREVEQVRARADRDRARLDSGQGSSKDLVGLQHELESLAGRQRDLEDVELEVLERRETDAGRLAAVETELATARDLLVDAAARRDAALAALSAEAAALSARRASTVAEIDHVLVGQYEKIRASRDGVGAARLVGSRCEGCHLDLPHSDLARIRGLPADEVVRCEECGRILVRADGVTGASA